LTVAPQEMLRHRQGDFAAIAMGQEKQRPVGMDLLEILDVAQREGLDQVLVAIGDEIERTKRVNRLLGS
jgi:hypothetical protein